MCEREWLSCEAVGEKRVGGLRRSKKKSEGFGCSAFGDRVGGLKRSERSRCVAFQKESVRCRRVRVRV